MARIPLIRFGNVADAARELKLATYTPAITLDNLVRGIDNLRHDVYLSTRFCEVTRAHLCSRLSFHGGVSDLIAKQGITNPAHWMNQQGYRGNRPQVRQGPGDFKQVLTDLQVEALNQAKARNNISIDLLARLATIKFLRAELSLQFAVVLERCRTILKGLETHSPERAVFVREQVAAMHVGKKKVLRQTGQELFQLLHDVEKQKLLRMRKSLFGDTAEGRYELLLNRLLFTENGQDDYVNAEHYVLLGNYDRDPDRFQVVRQAACRYISSLQVLGEFGNDERSLDAVLNVPENAEAIVAVGVPEERSEKGRNQQIMLSAWLQELENAGIMDHIVAAYEVLPLLAEYAPTINVQQLKNALVSRQERSRVERLIEGHGRLSQDNLQAAVKRVSATRGFVRSRLAGHFLGDFMRYHRDLRRFEAVASALDTVNLTGNEKMRELSSLNNLLYEFVLTDEKKPAEERISSHVVMKADVRDSTLVTRALSENGLNPASYFSLNFYGPVNKLLDKYGATKVFIEGDAIILALLERERDVGFSVGRACVLAREMVEIVRAYNDLSQKSKLPPLELGVGIAYQNSSPRYLMDGNSRIMISEALNESDRLSSCSKLARKLMPLGGPFNVYRFVLVHNNGAEEAANYNVSGIEISAAALARLRTEISLQKRELPLPKVWADEPVAIYTGLVPLENGMFHRLVVRESRVPRISSHDSSLHGWSETPYYEICTNPAVYEITEEAVAARAGR